MIRMIDVGALRHVHDRVPRCGRHRVNGAIISLRRHQIDEALEQIMAVLRAGARLGVVLHREDRLALEPQPLVGAVEQRDVGRPRRPSGRLSGSTTKPWFWLVISTLPVSSSLHRVVGAAMAAVHLAGAAAERQRQHLVAEADAEDRLAGRDQLAQHRHGVFAGRRRVARARSTGRCRRAGGA